MALDGTAVALEREFLHLPAGDIPLRGDHFCGAELRNLLGAIALAPAARVAERVRVTERSPRERRRPERNLVHGLHAAGNDEVLRSAHDGLSRKVHRLLR
jgi:hypothetical protein